MAYSKESISKVVKNAKKALLKYGRLSAEKIKISISKGNRKIGKVLNVSLMPILTCGNCKHCKGICYDIKACLQYPQVIDARVRNTVLAMKHRDKYFDEIRKVCKRRKLHKFFRWHVAGDILDGDYFQRMVDVAREFPDFKFWTYTKMYSIVNDWCTENGKENLPKNLSIMFSEWKAKRADGTYAVIPFPNPYNFPVFAVRFKGEPAPDMFKCPGNCDVCKDMKRGCPYGQSSYADEH